MDSIQSLARHHSGKLLQTLLRIYLQKYSTEGQIVICALFVGGRESASPGGTDFPYNSFPICEWVCETNSRKQALPRLQ